MSKHPVAVPTIAAVLTSALTIGIWTSIAPASASPTTVQVVSKVLFLDVIGSSVTANPGELGEGEATCPGRAWHAVSGGYLISGKEGPAVASAVDNFPIEPPVSRLVRRGRQSDEREDRGVFQGQGEVPEGSADARGLNDAPAGTLEAMAWKQKKKPINKPVLVAGIALHLAALTLTWRDISKRPADRIRGTKDRLAHREYSQHHRLCRVLARRSPTRLSAAS